MSWIPDCVTLTKGGLVLSQYSRAVFLPFSDTECVWVGKYDTDAPALERWGYVRVINKRGRAVEFEIDNYDREGAKSFMADLSRMM